MPKSAIVVVVSVDGHELDLASFGLVLHLSFGLLKLSGNRLGVFRGFDNCMISVNVSVTLRNSVPVHSGNDSGVDVPCI